MGVVGAVARCLERGELLAIEKQIRRRAFEMASFDDYGFRTHFDDLPGFIIRQNIPSGITRPGKNHTASGLINVKLLKVRTIFKPMVRSINLQCRTVRNHGLGCQANAAIARIVWAEGQYNLLKLAILGLPAESIGCQKIESLTSRGNQNLAIAQSNPILPLELKLNSLNKRFISLGEACYFFNGGGFPERSVTAV